MSIDEIMIDTEKIKINSLFYTHGHPAGYTDDLGIIADRNQWVNAELAGWYIFISYFDEDTVDNLLSWCKSNFSGYWSHSNKGMYTVMLHIGRSSDVTLFKMAWT